MPFRLTQLSSEWMRSAKTSKSSFNIRPYAGHRYVNVCASVCVRLLRRLSLRNRKKRKDNTFNPRHWNRWPAKSHQNFQDFRRLRFEALGEGTSGRKRMFWPTGRNFGNGQVPELAECRDAKKLL